MRQTIKVALTIFIAAGLLVGCARQPTIQLPPFPISEYESLPKTGTGSVKGQIFLKTVGGDVKYGAGVVVSLIPATSYSAYAWQAYQTNAKLTTTDPQVKKYTIRTQSDGSGNFEFHDVPRGQYYVGGEVTWQAPTQFGLAHQGGWVMNEVTVKEGTEARVIITK